MLRQVKPRNARSKRALEKKAPQVNENPKTTLFLRGSSCSQICQLVLTDLNTLKRPSSIKFTKKNDLHPFDDATSLEFFSTKNDASLLVFGHHSKKRPHSLTFTRTFDGRILDMLELYIVPETMRTLQQFKTKKPAIGLKPMITFSGTPFESPVANAYTLAKNILLDLLRGEAADKVDVEGLQYMIHISADDEVEGKPAPAIHMRSYLIQTKRSTNPKIPRVEVEEMGPRIDFRVGRIREADENMMKEALKKPKGTEAKTKKNVETDLMGDKLGRIHMGKQDLSKMQTRKMKGLKRSRDDLDDADTLVNGKRGRVEEDDDEDEDSS